MPYDPWPNYAPMQPAPLYQYAPVEPQLTLRDKLAAACLPAIYAHHTMLTDRAAELSYEQADEMLKAREPKPQCCGARRECAVPCVDCPENQTP